MKSAKHLPSGSGIVSCLPFLNVMTATGRSTSINMMRRRTKFLMILVVLLFLAWCVFFYWHA
jgi:hypothetical protein